MTNKVSISICILTINRVDNLIKCICSFYEQIENNFDFEIIILSNGSSFTSYSKITELYNQFENIKIIKCDTNIGLSKGRNVLAEKAQKEWLFFLDDDAFLGTPYFLKTLQEFINEQPEIGAIACNIIELKIPGKYYLPFSRKILNKMDLSKPCKCSYFLGGAHLIKSNLFKSIQGYNDLLFFSGEELDISYKIIDNNEIIWFHPELLVVHDKSEIKSITKSDRKKYELRNKIYLNHKYLPLKYSLISDIIWVIKEIYSGLSFIDTLKAIKDGAKLSSPKTILSTEAIKYLKKYHGRLYY